MAPVNFPATPPTAEQSIARQSDRRIPFDRGWRFAPLQVGLFRLPFQSFATAVRYADNPAGELDFHPGGLLSRGFKIRQLSGNITLVC